MRPVLVCISQEARGAPEFARGSTRVLIRILKCRVIVALGAVIAVGLLAYSRVAVADQGRIVLERDVTEQESSKQGAEHEPVKPTAEQISKAYMNCLIEVDKTISVLAGNTNLKAVRSETESQRAFCANRKRDCGLAPLSPECQTFIDEFKHTELTEPDTRAKAR